MLSTGIESTSFQKMDLVEIGARKGVPVRGHAQKLTYDAVGAGFSRRVPRSGIFETKWRLAAPATG
jgi:hypothetical protein